MTGGYPVVPNNQLKAEAKEILDSLPRKKPVTTGEPGLSYVDDLTGQTVRYESAAGGKSKALPKRPLSGDMAPFRNS